MEVYTIQIGFVMQCYTLVCILYGFYDHISQQHYISGHHRQIIQTVNRYPLIYPAFHAHALFHTFLSKNRQI